MVIAGRCLVKYVPGIVVRNAADQRKIGEPGA
jgi:hypothetical protein